MKQLMFFLFFQSSNDERGEIDINPTSITEKIDSWVDGFIKMIPNIGLAIVIIILGYFIAKLVGRLVDKMIEKRGRDNLGEMLGGLIKWVVFAVFVSLAITVVLPSLSPGDLIAGLGVSSVAIGFAFKDILQNWLAGLLILIRQPFELGDQIVVNGHEGTVEKIETRATIITTYGGKRIVIPNSEIYTNAVKVNTAHELIRSQYDVGIGYGDDLNEAIEVIKEAMNTVEGINKEKGVDVLPWGLDASWVTLRVRWWTKSERADVVRGMANVIPAIKYACDAAKIDMPYNTYVHLLHDQTEDSDGDRSKQREGWPSPKEQENTTPKWQAEQNLKAGGSEKNKI